jgi:outer membrane murein-binding lipoprotein Lpp
MVAQGHGSRPSRTRRQVEEVVASVDLDEVADELYALPPDEFIPTRKAREDEAKAEGDRMLAKEIAALPKPSTAAWVSNLLVREQPEEIAGLVELGGLVREAQQSLAGDQVRALDVQRRQLIAALTRQARSLAYERGHPVSTSVATQVEETLRAAMADPDAGEALLTGRLTSALTYSGLGVGERPHLRVVPPPKERPTPPPKAPREKATGDVEERRRRREEEARRAAEEKRRRELEEAERAAEEAAAAADEAAEAAEAAAALEEKLGTQEEGLRARIDELTHEMTRLREECAAVGTEHARAQRRRQAADHRRREADAARDRAVAHVEALERRRN